MTPARAARARGQETRLDRVIMRQRPWRSIEGDDTRGRVQPEHMQSYDDARAPKGEGNG
jgi:hypothetical protein